MGEIELCGQCGVPLMVSGGLAWGNNGVISLAISPRNRMVFYESENIDNLFRGVERLVGMPLEHIVVESRRRETRRYIEKIYANSLKDTSELAKERLRDGNLPIYSAAGRRIAEVARELNMNINNIGRIYGQGDICLGEGWDKGEDFPWRTQVIRHPYSISLYAADMLGAVEAVEGSDLWVEYQEAGDDMYRVVVFPSKHPIELVERLQRQRYDFKPGDFQYERCRVCSLPQEITRCTWDLDAGTITDPESGRRMSIFEPGSFDAILKDLEAELGEAIPDTVIAAQRDYVREHMWKESWEKDILSFRRMIAARGLGNLTDLDSDRKCLSVKLENSCLHLLMVGTTQAMVEMVYGVDDSACEWELSEDGDLRITIEA